jgi:hypothetical protein
MGYSYGKYTLHKPFPFFFNRLDVYFSFIVFIIAIKNPPQA